MNKTGLIKNITAFFKSAPAMITSGIALIAFVSSYAMRHDAKVIRTYVDSVEIRHNVRFERIENSITTLYKSIDENNRTFNNNFITVKNEFQDHIKKSKDIKEPDKLDAILRIVSGIDTKIAKIDTVVVWPKASMKIEKIQ